MPKTSFTTALSEKGNYYAIQIAGIDSILKGTNGKRKGLDANGGRDGSLSDGMEGIFLLQTTLTHCDRPVYKHCTRPDYLYYNLHLGRWCIGLIVGSSNKVCMNVKDRALSPVDIRASSSWHFWDGSGWTPVPSINIKCPPRHWRKSPEKKKHARMHSKEEMVVKAQSPPARRPPVPEAPNLPKAQVQTQLHGQATSQRLITNKPLQRLDSSADSSTDPLANNVTEWSEASELDMEVVCNPQDVFPPMPISI